MTQLQQLLKYQEADAKLYDIERKISTSDERKNYAKMKNYLTAAMEKLEQLDAKAGEMGKLISVLEEKYAQLSETLTEFSNVDELISHGGDLSFYRRNADSLLGKIKVIKKDIETLCDKIKEYEKEYQDLKKDVIKAQKLYNEYSEKYKALKNESATDVKAIKGELLELSKDIEGDVLAKYNAKRQEKVFPVLRPVVEGRCSNPKCRTELNVSEKQKLAKGELIECEYCHTMLYENK